MRRIIIAAVIAVIVVSVAVANLRRGGTEPPIDWTIKKRIPPKEVQVEHPRPAEIIETVTAPGTIELVEEADIASQIMGQVEQVNVEKGDRVKKGDLLVKLDDEDAKARLESTEARIERLEAAIEMAKADLEKALRDLHGYQELADRGFSTPTEVNDGLTTVAKMQAALEMSQHELKESYATRRTAEKALEFTEIRAPIDGTVIDLDVEVGEVVIAGTTNLPGTVLMTIGDMSRMRVRADVDETDVALVQPHQPVQIYLQADQDHPIAGSVDLIAPKGNKTGEVVSFETLIGVKGKSAALRPEMTATVEIQVKRAAHALSVPVQAVVHRRAKDLPDTPLFRDWLAKQPLTATEKGKDPRTRYIKAVFVLDHGVARARPVETGISDLERIEIKSGIGPDDTVIVGPFRALDEMTDGQPVVVKKPVAVSPGTQPKKTTTHRRKKIRVRL